MRAAQILPERSFFLWLMAGFAIGLLLMNVSYMNGEERSMTMTEEISNNGGSSSQRATLQGRKKKKPTVNVTVAPEPDVLPDRFIKNPSNRRFYIFTVDNRDPRGEGYRPFVAAANQFWTTIIPSMSKEKHEYIYLRSNISCSLKSCPVFPGSQQEVATAPPIPLHPSWMDLKGILHMLDNVMEHGDIATYLDSDAHFDTRTLKTFQQAYGWMLPEFFNGTRPIAVVRDRSHWTAVCHTDFGGPYSMDVNSGIIMFVKNRVSRAFFQRMWLSALTPSPQDKRKGTPLHYQFGWPHEQERLSWFASTPAENASITYIQRQGWHKELPWCFQVICHRNFDKMPYIEDYIKESITKSIKCDIPKIKPFCTPHGILDDTRYSALIDSLLDSVKVIPI
eukprot:jgi/Bigna1/78396/fgenesh1_pg.54_\